MTTLIPDPKMPKTSADQIYGEVMEPFEERMNFFLNEKIEVNKDSVKEEDKAAVDGLESVLQRFTTVSGTSVLFNDKASGTMCVDGLEAAGNVKKIIDILIQAAKDAVHWIMNLINNRVSRIDNRAYRIGLDRKRQGIENKEVNYPAGIRRLIAPLKVSLDPNWVNVALTDVNTFYTGAIKAYKSLTASINKVNVSQFDLASAIEHALVGVSSAMGLDREGTDYMTEVLPGNRRLVMEDVMDGDTTQIKLYFRASTTDVKLVSKTFEPSSFMIDETINVIKKTIANIRSNQSTVSQLYRTFEKTVRAYENNSEIKLNAQQREYLNWLVRFNKKLMTMTLQYVLNALDAGLDFVHAGTAK